MSNQPQQPGQPDEPKFSNIEFIEQLAREGFFLNILNRLYQDLGLTLLHDHPGLISFITDALNVIYFGMYDNVDTRKKRLAAHLPALIAHYFLLQPGLSKPVYDTSQKIIDDLSTYKPPFSASEAVDENNINAKYGYKASMFNNVMHLIPAGGQRGYSPFPLLEDELNAYTHNAKTGITTAMRRLGKFVEFQGTLIEFMVQLGGYPKILSANAKDKSTPIIRDFFVRWDLDPDFTLDTYRKFLDLLSKLTENESDDAFRARLHDTVRVLSEINLNDRMMEVLKDLGIEHEAARRFNDAQFPIGHAHPIIGYINLADFIKYKHFNLRELTSYIRRNKISTDEAAVLSEDDAKILALLKIAVDVYSRLSGEK